MIIDDITNYTEDELVELEIAAEHEEWECRQLLAKIRSYPMLNIDL